MSAVSSDKAVKWVMVPREPTEAMLKAAYAAQRDYLGKLGEYCDDRSKPAPDLCDLMYAAMLAAATPPPNPGEGPSPAPLGAEGLMHVGWWIDGPKRSELIFASEDTGQAVGRICAETGDDPDDYTVTKVFAQTFNADLGFNSPADREAQRLTAAPQGDGGVDGA